MCRHSGIGLTNAEAVFCDCSSRVMARVSGGFTFGSQMAGRENTGLREPWDPNGRAPRGLRPRCGARTRKNMGCLRQALANGRGANHEGLSTGPKTNAGWQAHFQCAKTAMERLPRNKKCGGREDQLNEC